MRRSAAVALGGVLAGIPHAHAEIAVMSSGGILYVDGYHREDQLITLYLTGGGEVRVPSELVANIVANEILPAREAPEARATELPLLPHLVDLIAAPAKRFGVDPRLVAAVIWVESSGDPKAVSRRGARGLMQLMPETARNLGVRDVFDPAQNVDGGVRYLRGLLDRHGQDLSVTLAAYNAGPAAVARYGGVPPYKETQIYVRRVLDTYHRQNPRSETPPEFDEED